MFRVAGVTYEFHHLGIPTTDPRPGERYSAVYGMYTADDPCAHARVQWHRFEPSSPLHPLLKQAPHLAFRVSDLEKALAGKTVILGPYEPIPGFRVAAVADGGVAIELIETALGDEQIWARAESNSILYSEDDGERQEALNAASGSGQGSS